MSKEDQLRNLIDLTPPHIQRHFACDCAERALRREEIEDERSWRVILIARQYAEGKAIEKDLVSARDAAFNAAQDAARVAAQDAAQDAAWDAAWDATWAAAWDAAWDAAWAAAWDAAQDAAQDAAWDKEREWQIEHLQSLIAAHNAARSSLLHILQQRAEALRPTFTQYARTLEERAFE